MNLTQYFYLGEALFWKKNYRNGVLTKESRYNYDGKQLVQERDGANNVVHEYAWGLGLPGGIGGLLDLYKSAVHYSYLYDGKGNVTALLDPLGNTAAAYKYDPFGVPRGPANTLSQPFQFSTKQYDEKTGLSYYGYRFYVPSLGRWLTRDPLGEAGGINLYEFVFNNPINAIDPDGLHWIIPGRIPFWWRIPRYVPPPKPGGKCPQPPPAPRNAPGQPPEGWDLEGFPESWKYFYPNRRIWEGPPMLPGDLI